MREYAGAQAAADRVERFAAGISRQPLMAARQKSAQLILRGDKRFQQLD